MTVKELERMVIETEQCVCKVTTNERGRELYRVKAKNPPTKDETYNDERPARVATSLRTICPRCTDCRWGRETARLPLAVATSGPETVAGWLYLRHQDSRHADQYNSPYKYISDEMDVREQTARNYISRLLNVED